VAGNAVLKCHFNDATSLAWLVVVSNCHAFQTADSCLGAAQTTCGVMVTAISTAFFLGVCLYHAVD
jgi:hypothetical protein